jgi:HEPN domain-containing protein
MTTLDIIRQWREGASESFIIAEFAASRNQRGMMLFHCHLALEKALKALYMEQKKEVAPFTHNLGSLAIRIDIALDLQEKEFLDALTPQSVKGRYDDIDIDISTSTEHLPDTKTLLSMTKNLLEKLSISFP